MRRYKRFSFGISSAAEVFQNKFNTAFEKLHVVRNNSDNIIFFGENQLEYDKNLKVMLKGLSERKLSLNKDKSEFNKSQLQFYEHTLNHVFF